MLKTENFNMQSAARLDFKERSAAIERLVCLPPLSESAVNTVLSNNQELTGQALKLVVDGPPNEESSKQANHRMPALQERAAVATNLTSRVATFGDVAFKQRARLITLCGWALQTLNVPVQRTSVTLHGDVGHFSGQKYLRPESCNLACGMCGAKAGLWSYFPESQPQACVETAAAHAALRGGTSSAPPESTISRPTGPPPSHGKNKSASFEFPKRYVGFALSETIAGGAIDPGVAVSLSTPGSAALDASRGGSADACVAEPVSALGGPSHGLDPSTATGTDEVPAPGPAHQRDQPFGSGFPPNSRKTVLQDGDNDRDNVQTHQTVPVFGFEALRAQAPTSASTSLSSSLAASKKRSLPITRFSSVGHDDDRLEDDVNAKRSKMNSVLTTTKKSTAMTAASVNGEFANAASSQAGLPPSGAVLQRYRGMATVPLDPLAAHRPFCPWVHAVHAMSEDVAEIRGAPCGWQWSVQQLSPGSHGKRSGGAGTGTGTVPGSDEYEEEGDGNGGGASWNPSQILRNALAKVEVKK